VKKLFLFFVTAAVIAVFSSCSDKSEIKTTESGLKYSDETVGEGRDAKFGDLVQSILKVG